MPVLGVQMAELTQAIVTFELGSAVAVADHYNIREVHTSADQYTPVIFVLPTEVQGPAWEATQGELGGWWNGSKGLSIRGFATPACDRVWSAMLSSHCAYNE